MKSAIATESLRLLEWWSGELDRMYLGEVAHPVFVALEPTRENTASRNSRSPISFAAFIQDQTVTRYQNWEGVFDYCVYSANPVGRWCCICAAILTPSGTALSDATCTALQLANFWQDITVDQLKDRVYLPLDLLDRHGYTVDDLFAHRYDARFVAIMREAVDRARELFVTGPAARPGWWTGVSRLISISSAGAACAYSTRSSSQNYDVLSRRPKSVNWNAWGCCSALSPARLRAAAA